MSKKFKRRLEDRILFFKPVLDEDKKEFIPYCTLVHHKGICINESYKVCEERQCHHYKRLYLNLTF
jgi:hypothetical protein